MVKNKDFTMAFKNWGKHVSIVPIPPDAYDLYGVRVREILKYGNYVTRQNCNIGKNLGALLLK